MTGASPTSRDERIAALAAQLVAYLRQQTEIVIDMPGDIDPDGPAPLLAAFERLDLALGQLADIASVYDEGPGPALEPLALPLAALTGEHLRHVAAAHWLPADPDDPNPDDSLLLVTADGIVIDLLGVARAALLSGAPNLTAVVSRLIASDR
ncbi:MAG: hypothetical protein ACRD1H_13995 [Vicinamibacterales bacterium]